MGTMKFLPYSRTPTMENLTRLGIDDRRVPGAQAVCAWAHDFCRRNKTDTITMRDARRGPYCDPRTNRRYFCDFIKAGWMTKTARGEYRVESFFMVGHALPIAREGTSDAASDVPSTQVLKMDAMAISHQESATIDKNLAASLEDKKALSKKDLRPLKKTQKPDATTDAWIADCVKQLGASKNKQQRVNLYLAADCDIGILRAAWDETRKKQLMCAVRKPLGLWYRIAQGMATKAKLAPPARLIRKAAAKPRDPDIEPFSSLPPKGLFSMFATGNVAH